MAVAASRSKTDVWLPVLVDIDSPIRDVPMEGATHLYVTAFTRARPLGTILLPARLDPFPGTALADTLAHLFAEAIHRERLRAALMPPQPPAPALSTTVLVCTRDRPDDLARCLAAISKLRGRLDEVLVVDNGSADPRVRDIVLGGDARYVSEPVAGLDRARNRGVAEARGDVVLCTDDDVMVDPGWAEALLACFADPLVMAATGLVLPAVLDTPARQAFEEFAGFGRGLRRRVFDGAMQPPTGAGAAGAGASMAFRTGFLRRIGGFPEELDAGTATGSGGDTYALYRVMRAGFRVVYDPAAVALHTHRESPEELDRALAGYGTGVFSYYARAVQEDRDAGAAVAAGRWAVCHIAPSLARAATRRRTAPPLRLVAAEARGALATITAYPAARQRVRRHAPVLEPGVPLRPWTPANEPSPLAPGESLPSLSVVIPSLDRPDMLARLLRALEGQQYPPDLVEVIVSLDGASAASEAAIRTAGLTRPPTVVVGRGAPSGAGATRNRGAAAARHDILIFLDDDVVPAHARVLLAHGREQAAGAALVPGPVPPTVWETDDVFSQRVRNWWVDHTRRLCETSTLGFTDISTGNLSLPREAFQTAGGFQPMPRREDWELGYRLLEAGLPVRPAPRAAVLHDAAVSLSVALADRRDEGAGDVRFAELHPRAAALLPLASWHSMTGRERRIVRALLAKPRRFDGLLAAARRALAPLAVAGLRDRYGQVLGTCSALAYWSGVAAATGSEASFLAIIGDAGRPEHTAPVIDLAAGDMPAAGLATSHVDVAWGDLRLGAAPLAWAGIPYDAGRFADALVAQFGDRSRRAAARGIGRTARAVPT